MNGDILSNIDFRKLLDSSLKNDSLLTVVTKEIRTPFNFGSVKVKDEFIVGVEEKPDLVLEILAGIYLMKPEILGLVPRNEYFGIDSLIKKMLAEKMNISRHLMKEYWLDIGRLDDYEEAQIAYEKHFKKY
jgi:NDP-sugar pyrophosphorylase family protein